MNWPLSLDNESKINQVKSGPSTEFWPGGGSEREGE